MPATPDLDSGYKIADPAGMLIGELPPLDRHPGIYFREVLMPQWGLKVAPLARAIGVNRANLHEVLSGRSDVSRELAYRLGALLNDHVGDFLIGYQLAWDIERERERREQLKREIERLPTPAEPPR